ncbi:uncharacterized protein PHACADRAFT_179651 [Phanerochaete carnosa HHB-10118-sp]|uniref:F-box domain-containing protein n=1 Tax=Phanerochaete carnosa (strain HHB-10118-sp) TaxID=650164 RepID=K5XBI2_PHACS|nr:uncharacterized protein PHACADRAFT_179651 [Phanerochaete carnosa HHB-10118-sp]EKM60297.1 hypothetical protein PHACADRAFT_179651 [Phanerochaete carnosa HHB-10118-sp]
MSLLRLRPRFPRRTTAVVNVESVNEADVQSFSSVPTPPCGGDRSAPVELTREDSHAGGGGSSTSPFPINRLAPELLAEVFYWCILHVCVIRLENRILFPTPYSWLTIRHVCRAWREIALAFPKLSTHIWLTRPECVADMLSRSGTLPLHIYSVEPCLLDIATVDAEREAELFGLVLPQFARVAHASLVFAARAADDRWPDPRHVRRAVSRLESLTLRIYYNWTPPLPLFAGYEFPALRELECAGTSADVLHPLIVPGLCRLRLSSCNILLEEQLLPLLRQLGALGELELERAVRLSEESHRTLESVLSSSDPRDKILLPRLKKLSIVDIWGDAGFCLMHRLSFPLPAYISMQTLWVSSNLSSSCHDYADIIIATMEGITYKTLSLSTILGTGFAIDLWNDRLAADSLPPQRHSGGTGRFSFLLGCHHSFFMQCLIDRLPLSQIESALLVEKAVGFAHGVSWETVLSSMPAVEDLALRYETFDHLTPSTEPYHITTADTRTPCPSLKTLRIREFHRRSSVIQSRSPDLAHLSCLARGLAARRDDPSLALSGPVDVTQQVENFHVTYPCLRGGGPNEERPPSGDGVDVTNNPPLSPLPLPLPPLPLSPPPPPRIRLRVYLFLQSASKFTFLVVRGTP